MQSEQKYLELRQKCALEDAFRRGFTQGEEEAGRLVFQLLAFGYSPTVINRLCAVYDDHFLAP